MGTTHTVRIDASIYRDALRWAGVPLAATNSSTPGHVDITDQHGAEVDYDVIATRLMEGLIGLWIEYGQPDDPIPVGESANAMGVRRMREALERFTRAAEMTMHVVSDDATERPLAQLRDHVRNVRAQAGLG